MRQLGEVTRQERFEAGADIVTIGDPGQALYIVMSGEVQVVYPARSAEYELARLGAGEFFGEMALLNEMPRSATVRAVEDVHTLTLDKEAFREQLLRTPSVAVALLATLSTRIRNADEQISGLSDKAMKDPMTGLLNRRAFNDRISEECDRTRRYGEPFSLVLIDLDKFKSINDRHGHPAGDAVLVEFGRRLSENTRSVDLVARIGGEEFVVIMPDASLDDAHAAAERIRSAVERDRFTIEGGAVDVTTSVGVATLCKNDMNGAALVARADAGLFLAKASGRNRVILQAA